MDVLASFVVAATTRATMSSGRAGFNDSSEGSSLVRKAPFTNDPTIGTDDAVGIATTL